MSPLSAPVLGGAALMSSPALWGAFVDGTTSMQTAMLRFLICMALCWAGLAVVSTLVGPPATRPAEQDAAPGLPAEREAA